MRNKVLKVLKSCESDALTRFIDTAIQVGNAYVEVTCDDTFDHYTWCFTVDNQSITPYLGKSTYMWVGQPPCTGTFKFQLLALRKARLGAEQRKAITRLFPNERQLTIAEMKGIAFDAVNCELQDKAIETINKMIDNAYLLGRMSQL
jgi:hypothetical protein